MTIHNLQKFFEPDTVAVIGASEAEGSVGTTLLQNLLRGFEGKTFAVNPNRESALGQPTYPRVSSLPESPDLAVIATPAPTIPSIVEECGKEGIPAAVIVSSGFSEVGEEGSKLQDAIEDRRKKFGMRILGPNCLGFIRPPTQLNVSFAREVPSAGHVAFISQSGAMGASLIDWSTESRIGFSALISIGNILDVGFSDLIDYFGKDPTTKSIILYMETLKDPDAFIRAARPVARRKPIICLKGGRHLKSRPLVSSHIGLSPRRDEMYEALFKRIGITRVPTLEDLFACSEILAHDSLPDDSSLAVVTNANGPAILALDSILDQGGKVASLTEDTRGKLCEVLPYQVNLTNPLDLLGDANRARYEECGRIVSEDEHVDALLFIYCPQGEASARDAAEAVVAVEKNTKIPVFTAWIGGKEAREGRRLLRENGIVTSTAPEKAARAYLYLYQYLRNLEMLYQTPEYLESSSGDYSLSKSIKKSAQEGPTRLPRAETQKLLRSYGLNPLSQRPVDSFSEVKEFASSNSFPLALKGSAGLEIIVRSRNQLDSAFSKMNEQESRLYIREKIPKGSLSLRISSYRDKLFGSLIMIEPTAKNTPRESSTVGFPPLNQVLARRLLEESGIDRRLGNTTKNQSSSLRQLEKALVSFSQLLVDFPEIVEINIPRLYLAEKKLRVSGAEVTLELHETEKDVRQYPHMIISPYPERYIRKTKLKNGRPVTIRPIRPEDEPLEVDLFRTFSSRTWRDRFFSSPQQVTHEKMSTFTNIDYRREMAMVGIIEEDGEKKMAGVARVIVDLKEESGEYAIVIGDPWQGLGLGRALTESLIEWARDMNLYSIHALIRVDNSQMIGFCKHLGFRTINQDGEVIKMNFPL